MCKHEAQLLTPDQFTAAFIAEQQRLAPRVRVTTTGPLELKVADEGGRESGADLHNSYDQYRRCPEQLDAILTHAAQALLKEAPKVGGALDEGRIVPVIKPKAWVEQILRGQHNKGIELPPLVYTPYNEEIAVVYAEDNPTTVRYINHDDLRALGWTREELHAKAVENLRSVLGEAGLQGGEGVYLLSAGGTYEPSAILLDAFWESRQIPIEGDYVVAVPERGTLIITGSGNAPGVAKLRDAAGHFSQSAYRISSALFIYREGRFQVFGQNSA